MHPPSDVELGGTDDDGDVEALWGCFTVNGSEVNYLVYEGSIYWKQML